MLITYFTNNYPAVSHTFIRRELQELERRGHAVQRISLRGQSNLVDLLDIDERSKTIHLLEQSRLKMLRLMIRRIIRTPMGSLSAMGLTISLWRSGNKLTKVFSYFAESLILAELCHSHRSELVRVHFGTNGALVARLCHRLGGPMYAVAYHGPDEFDNPVKWDIHGTVSESAFVTAITSYCSAQLMRWTPREHWKKIHIVRCAVGSAFLTPSPLPTSNRRDLCIVARLSAQKGIPLLIDGFAQAVAKGADIGLHIVGDGEMRDEVEARIHSFMLDDRVVMHGSLSSDDVRAVIEKSCGIVLPSFAEGLPVVLMEAMGMGRPAITTAIAGIPELIDHGKNGWLIPSGNIELLVDSLVDFANLPYEDLVAMGLHGHGEVKKRHQIDHEVEVLDTIIHKLMVGN